MSTAIYISFAFFGECAVGANHSGTSWGFSGVNYAFYAYVIVDYIFMFIFRKQSKVSIIYGAIILAKSSTFSRAKFEVYG